MRALALLALLGCGEPSTYFEPPPSGAARAEILAIRSRSDLSLFAISRDEPVAFRFEAEDAFTAESLLYDRSLEELGLAEGRLERAEGASRGIPEPSRVYREEFDPGSPASSWMEIDRASEEVDTFRTAGSCALLGGSLAPYAAEAVALTEEDDRPGAGEVRIRRIEIIDGARVLAMTNNHLHLIRRAQRYQVGETTRYTTESPRSFTYDRDRGRVWVVGGSLLAELTLDDAGLHLVGTSSGCANPIDVLEEVVVDDLGRPVIATDRGAVCRRENGAFTPLRGIELLFGANILNLIRTGDPAHPFLASAASRVYLYDGATNTWSIGDGINDLTPPFLPYALASRTNQGRLESWAAGSSARIFTQVSNAIWQPWSIRFPPDFAPCGTGTYPHLSSSDDIRALLLVEDRALITLEFCAAIVELDASGRCAMLSGTRELRGDTFDAIASDGETVVVGGTNGVLYEARRR